MSNRFVVMPSPPNNDLDNLVAMTLQKRKRLPLKELEGLLGDKWGYVSVLYESDEELLKGYREKGRNIYPIIGEDVVLPD